MSVKSLLIEKISNGYVLTVEVKEKTSSELVKQTKFFNTINEAINVVSNLFEDEVKSVK